jgi:hypothetical protein
VVILYQRADNELIIQDLADQVREIRLGLNDAHKNVDHLTIFQEVLNSDLPVEEKSGARIQG